MIRLYMDEHVPSAITDGLRLRNVDVITVQEDGMDGEDDGPVLDRATSLGRVVFTMDEDFFKEAAERQRSGVTFAGVVYARQSRITIGQCVADLELIAQAGEPEDLQDQLKVLPL